MPVQFSRQAIAAFLHLRKIAKTGSCLVRRLVRAQNDPGKERIRKWLIDLDDAQLRSGLGPDAGRHCCPARWYAASLPDGGLSPRPAAGGYTRGIGRGRGALTAVSNLQLYQKSMPGSFRTRTSLRTRPDPVLARLPGETFGID